MLREDGDSKVVAFGGSVSLPLDGMGDDWPEGVSEELISHGITDHLGLWAAKEIMISLRTEGGSTVGNNDGFVPLTSALLGSGHTSAEKINLTQTYAEPIDHVSYLDVASTMDYVANRLSTMVRVTISPQTAVDAGARWRITGGAWQKSGVSLNTLSPGQYSIEFMAVSGWTTPANQTVTVVQNTTTHLTGGDATYTQVVNPPTITTTCPLPSGMVDTSYNQTLTATGGTTPYTWTISSGALPPGLSLDSGTGVISGTPTAANTYNFTIRCTGANSQYSEKVCSATINPVPAPTITTSCPLPDGTVGIAYSERLEGSGGTTPYTWTISSGALPPGLSLDSGTGVISGTPSSANTYNFTIRCTGANSQYSENVCSATITPVPPPTIATSCPLPSGTVGVVYNQPLAGSGGTSPYMWTISGGALPPGLSLSGTGAISGTPTTANTYDFTIRCAGANSQYSEKVCSATIAPATPPNVIAWGDNSSGQTNVPPQATNVVAISAGGFHNLSLKADGTVVPWGDNRFGQTTVPAAASNVAALSAGFLHNLALTAGGSILGWGEYTLGQTNVPPEATNVVALAAGGNFNLALKADGSVVSWGEDNFGKTNVPATATNVVAIAAATDHSLVVRADGQVVSWGWNVFGQTNVPPAATNVVAVAAGSGHSLALKADGTVVAWGRNLEGQANVPPEASNVVAIAAGGFHNLALRADGSVVGWGTNGFGQTHVPAGATNVVAIGAGWNHSLALVGSGAPVITVQPFSRTVGYGDAVAITVMAVGIQPMSYQWQLNGTNITGEINSSMTIGAAQFNDAGNYTVVVSNSLGVVTSRVATLVVKPATLADLPISIERAGTDLRLTWSVGTLLSADDVNGPWSPVAGASSPWVVTPNSPRKFYRLQQ